MKSCCERAKFVAVQKELSWPKPEAASKFDLRIFWQLRKRWKRIALCEYESKLSVGFELVSSPEARSQAGDDALDFSI